MNSIKSFLWVFILGLLSSCATPQKKQAKIFRPAPQEANLVVLDHEYFKIGYDPKLRLAHYVVYELSADKLRKRVAKRRNKFRPDPKLVSARIPFVKSSEYRKSGYDQGHLAPSADFSWSQKAQDLTFVMSNMAPQKPKLNRDAWRRLEEKVRRWACGEKRITVITGPIFRNHQHKLKSGLRVPESFYKIVIDETPPKKALAFIYHQDDKGDVLEKRKTSLQNVSDSSLPQLFSFIPDYKAYARAPASLNSWKEADCSKRSGGK